MEDESTGASAMMKWITKLTRKITSRKIAPVHYGEDLPSSTTDFIKDARAAWIVCLSGAAFDVKGLRDALHYYCRALDAGPTFQPSRKALFRLKQLATGIHEGNKKSA